MTIRIENLPFFWRTTATPLERVSGIPQNLPFEFDLLEEAQLLIQKRTPELLESLNRIYHLDANIGFLQEGHALAEGYGSDFQAFLKKTAIAGVHPLKQVTEIGCGGGIVLKHLMESGISVRGIDPSPLALRQSQKFGFEIIPQFYPVEGLSASDLIFHYDVLEHVPNPVEFLRSNFNDLKNGGYLVVGMPDASESIACGDISMAMHEHLNYFDETSLRLALGLAGFSEILIERSKFGGLLFCCARKHNGSRITATTGSGKQKLADFSGKAVSFIGRIEKFVSEIPTDSYNSNLAFYVPIRAFPYTSYLGLPNVRYFDDSASLRHRYYDGCGKKVEDFQDFLDNPPSHVIVASFPFGKTIKEKILSKFGSRIRVSTLSDFREMHL